MIHYNQTYDVFAVPWDNQLVALFPGAPRIEKPGCTWIVLPNEDREKAILRILGHHLPGDPWNDDNALSEPEPEITPFPAQKATIDFLLTHKRGYILNGMGTGKTLACLWAFQRLQEQGEASRMLVVCPLSVMQVWSDECERVGLVPLILHASTKGRRIHQLLDAADWDVAIINHDGVCGAFVDLLGAIADVLVIDEVAVYRSRTAQRSKDMAKLAERFDRVYGLTGTPCPQGPCDVWKQARIVTPWTVPEFDAFRKTVCTQISRGLWVANPNAYETAARVMQPAIRFATRDVVVLPDTAVVDRLVKLSASQAGAYTESKSFVQKLQISTGYAYTDAGVQRYDADDRERALLNAVQREGQSIVFVTYKHTLAGVSELLTRAGITCAAVNGATPTKKRTETFRKFQAGKFKVLIAQPRCMAHGVSLTAADKIVYYGPPHGSEVAAQSAARILRPGQTRQTSIVNIWSSKAEAELYKKTDLKLGRQEQFLSMF